MVFTSVHKQPRTRLARRLGAPLDPEGYVIVDDHGATNVPGLFAAGDVAAGHAHQVSAAVHEGSTAATAVNWFLMEPLERGDVAASSPDATA